MAEQLSRAEAVDILTMARDLLDDTQSLVDYKRILLETGEKIGYAPAFRCLVKGLEPEESVRWGK